MKHSKAEVSVIDAQLAADYESGSGFRDAFSRIMEAPSDRVRHLVLTAAWLDTRLGAMVAIADEKSLYLLEFVDRRGLENEIRKLRKKLNAAIIPGETTIIKSIAFEMANYLDGKDFVFTTPVHLNGSPFQIKVWKELRKISPGETRSYSDIAKSINAPTACRAVARANGANPLTIIVPCHRVINANGDLGGYASGLARKQWLLGHENTFWKDNPNE